MMRRTIVLLSTALIAAACTDGASDSGKVPFDAFAASKSAAPSAPTGDVITGTLLEQIAAESYAYLKLKTATGEVWVAVTEPRLTVGSQVTVYGAMLMQNFESKTLKRTFDAIYFGSLDDPNAAPGVATGQSGVPTSNGAPPAVDAKVSKVEKASGADARTIAELWGQKTVLADKTVSIRGQVVKYNPGVMGKNWIHLQDGSGAAAQGTHDITVTTMSETTVGATITITGTVRLNKDFGAGYAYALIVEDAKVVAK